MRKSRSITTASSFVFSAIALFTQLQKHDTDIVASYYCILPYLQHCYALLTMSNAAQDYWKCYINVVTRTCLGFYWYIHTLPRTLHALGNVCIYQSSPSLLCYTLLMYVLVCIHTSMHLHPHVHVRMSTVGVKRRIFVIMLRKLQYFVLQCVLYMYYTKLQAILYYTKLQIIEYQIYISCNVTLYIATYTWLDLQNLP